MYKKNNLLECLKWVNFMECELYLNKTVFFKLVIWSLSKRDQCRIYTFQWNIFTLGYFPHIPQKKIPFNFSHQTVKMLLLIFQRKWLCLNLKRKKIKSKISFQKQAWMSFLIVSVLLLFFSNYKRSTYPVYEIWKIWKRHKSPERSK